MVEGLDDLAALREVFPRLLGSSKPDKSLAFPAPEKANTFRWPNVECDVLSAGSKNKIVSRVAQQIRTPPAIDQSFEMIGLCFDPDAQTDTQPHEWLAKGFKESGIALQWSNQVCTARCGESSYELVLLAWDLGGLFDRLRQERNLERTAIEVLTRADKQESELVNQWLSELQQKQKHTTWKTAFRLWAAIRYADRDPDTGGAMAQVFGQDEAARSALGSVLQGSTFLSRLKRFAGTAQA